MALKILINSLYGSISNKFFVLFNRDIAASITGNGRAYIRGLSRFINKKLNKLLKKKENEFENFVVYNDTDSVSGDTIIETDNYGKIKIEDYFNKARGILVYRKQRKDFVKIIAPINNKQLKEDVEFNIFENDRTYSLSMGLGRIRKNRILSIMRHQVKKKMYRIRVKDKFVTVTEDHSVIIRKDNSLIEVKPTNMKKGDECIFKKIDSTDGNIGILFDAEFTTDWDITPLGGQEQYVYDIEVENDHNFFGNNICVHNSAYLTIEPVVNAIIKNKFNGVDYKDMDLETKNLFLDTLLTFVEKYVDTGVNDFTQYYAQKFNSYDPSAIGAKLEKIADSAIHVAKKKYALRVIYDEGDRRIESPKIAVTGLEIVRSSTPTFCRKYLKEAVELLMDKSEKEIQYWIAEVKEQFMNAPVEDISRVSGVSNLNYQLIDGKYKRLNPETGKYIPAPINSRAAILHNNLVKKMNLQNKFTLITERDKIKYVYLKVPNIAENNDVIAYLDPKFLGVTGLDKYLDKELMFEKFFISPIEIMLDVMGYESERSTTVDDWF